MAGLWIGLGLLALGALLGAAGLLLVGVVWLFVWLLRSLWTRFGLRNVVYERRLSTRRATVGEEIGLELVVRNRKLLPLPWLEIEDLMSDETRIVGRTLEPSELQGVGILRTTWSLGWYQRVTRRLRISAHHRGIYHFRAARLRVADLFARNNRADEQELGLRYAVVPRSVPVRIASSARPLPGPARARRGLFEEPSRFAGVRPYMRGDSARRIHWKATARLRRPVSRRYDPGREEQLILALDVQTVAGPHWLLHYDDDLLETLCTTAMSLARSVIAGGVACGLAANGLTLRPARTLNVAPSAAPSQVARIADDLAALSPFASVPFNTLLDTIAQRAPMGVTVMALSAQDPIPFVPTLRRLAATGRAVQMVTVGADAAASAGRSRAAGVPTAVADLAPDWRTADALTLVG